MPIADRLAVVALLTRIRVTKEQQPRSTVVVRVIGTEGEIVDQSYNTRLDFVLTERLTSCQVSGAIAVKGISLPCNISRSTSLPRQIKPVCGTIITR
jgi:hypothetical protein